MENIKDNETADLRSLFISYLSHWKLIGGSALVAFIGAVLYLIIYPTTYETTAQILLQDDKDSFSSNSFGLGEAAGLMKSFGISSTASSTVNLEDELVTLTSNQTVREMVVKLGLYVDYMEPFTFGYKLYGTEPLKISCDSITLANLEHTIKLDIHHTTAGKVHIDAKMKKGTFKTVKASFDLESLPAKIQVDKYPLTITYAADSVKNGEFDLLAEVRSPISVAEELIEEFVIEDYSKSSNVLQMTCLDYEKQRAKDMLATLIACYNNQAEEYKKQLGDKSLSFIMSRLNSVLSNLEKIEAQIEAYKSKNKMTIVEYDVQMYAAAMQELQVKLIELEAQIHLVDLMDEFVHNPDNKYKLVPSLYSPSEGETAGDLSAYNQILIERERVIKNSSENNPLVSALSVQADGMRESVYKMINNTKKGLTLTRDDLKKKEQMLLDKMGAIPQQERVYVDLKRQQEIYQGVYLVLLQKKEEIELAVGQGKDKARIIDAPYTKTAPVAPRKLFAAIGIILFTFVVSVGWLSAKWLFLSVWNDLKEELAKKKE